MGLFPTSLHEGHSWWWAFGLLIAVPALVLALLGLWAVRAERLQEEQQLRERQAQVARLADGALENLLTELEDRLRRVETERLEKSIEAEGPPLDAPVFSFDRRGLLTFPRDRLYTGPFGERPDVVSARSDWPGPTQRLIDRARAAEAQKRWADARALYRTGPPRRTETSGLDCVQPRPSPLPARRHLHAGGACCPERQRIGGLRTWGPPRGPARQRRNRAPPARGASPTCVLPRIDTRTPAQRAVVAELFPATTL